VTSNPSELTDAAGAALDPAADSEERAELRRALRALIERESPPDRVSRLDESETFDDALYAGLARLGALGVGTPGGLGDLRDQLVVIEELAAGPTSMAGFMIGHYAVTEALGRFGSGDEQRGVLERLSEGVTKVAFALSEPEGGTDVARVMRTRAQPIPGGGHRLTGHKMWTSGAAAAEWVIVMARTSPIERSAADGITMFLTPTDAPGLQIGTLETFGMRSLSTCEIFLDGVEVGPDAVVGEVDRGMRQAFRSVNREGLLAAAASLGVGREALALAAAYAKERVVFNRPIGAFQVPQHWLVDTAVALESARGLMTRAAAIEVGGGDAANLAAMAKLVASEAASDAALRGMQLMGGMGYTRAVPLQRLFRDGRLWSFSPLTNEMVRNGLGQRLLGLPRSF
jgi:alkylation response protein AidB-like acyl-CoA dehydrogenase